MLNPFNTPRFAQGAEFNYDGVWLFPEIGVLLVSITLANSPIPT